jgi:hypothetical protein
MRLPFEPQATVKIEPAMAAREISARRAHFEEARGFIGKLLIYF